jgi:hypothetical protein
MPPENDGIMKKRKLFYYNTVGLKNHYLLFAFSRLSCNSWCDKERVTNCIKPDGNVQRNGSVNQKPSFEDEFPVFHSPSSRKNIYGQDDNL